MASSEPPRVYESDVWFVQFGERRGVSYMQGPPGARWWSTALSTACAFRDWYSAEGEAELARQAVYPRSDAEKIKVVPGHIRVELK